MPMQSSRQEWEARSATEVAGMKLSKPMLGLALGLMHHAVYKFIVKDHFQTIWTFRKDQKDAGSEDMTFVRTR